MALHPCSRHCNQIKSEDMWSNVLTAAEMTAKEHSMILVQGEAQSQNHLTSPCFSGAWLDAGSVGGQSLVERQPRITFCSGNKRWKDMPSSKELPLKSCCSQQTPNIIRKEHVHTSPRVFQQGNKSCYHEGKRRSSCSSTASSFSQAPQGKTSPTRQ
jgi:hypothetical protein